MPEQTLKMKLVIAAHQLPVESPSGVGSLLTQEPAVVLGLCSNTDGLHHLAQIDEVHET